MEKLITITPNNVNDLAARLSFLFCPRIGPVPIFEFRPSEGVCGITMRLCSPITIFDIQLTPQQVESLIRQGSEAAESWASVLRVDLMTLGTKDGKDPRLADPEDGESEEPPF